MLNLNVAPYFDDFDETKGYHKVLFVPGRPIQARELTQLQTMLQAQIKRGADHTFKNGTLVIPGHVFYDNKVKYVKLKETTNSVSVTTKLPLLVDKEIYGETSGVKATVIHYEQQTATESPVLFVKYTASGIDSTTHIPNNKTVFDPNEKLLCAANGVEVETVSDDSRTGDSAIASIAEGVYYINGYFVQVLAQKIVLSKFSSTPSCKVGLQFEDSFVTPTEDWTLNDNALGFSNYAAPGAHRYKIELILAKKDVDYNEVVDTAVSDEVKFIDLLQVRNGEIQYLINDTKYAEIERWLARRTFDESGDYIVEEFTARVSHSRSNERGAWAASTPYLVGDVVYTGSTTKSYYVCRETGVSGNTAPNWSVGTQNDGSLFWTFVKVPVYNDGYTIPLDSDNLGVHRTEEKKNTIVISKGKAYINGFEIKKDSKTVIEYSKPRDYTFVNQSQFTIPETGYIDIVGESWGGLPSISTMSLCEVRAHDNTVIGSVRPLSITYVGGTTYRLYCAELTMNPGYTFKTQAHKVVSGTFSAKISKTAVELTGIVSSSSTALTGFGTNFDQEIAKYTEITYSGGSSFVSVLGSDTAATLSSAPSPALSNTKVYAQYASYTEGEPSIVALPNSYIKSAKNDMGEIDTIYDTSKIVDATSGTSTNITLRTGETLLPTGHIFIPASGNPSQVASTGATVNHPSATTGDKLIVQIRKSTEGALEKAKTLQRKTIYVFDGSIYLTADHTGTAITPSSNKTFKGKTISLTEADGFQLLKVMESSQDNIFVASGAVDITRYYSMDNGQRDTYYDVASIISSGYVPSKPLEITFEYFDHSSNGDYFSVDSYASIPYNMIPSYKGISLRDCIDYRPRMDDVGVSVSNNSQLTFKSIFTLDYSHYLPRTDVLVIGKDGEVELIEGVSSVNPKKPEIPSDKLDIYVLEHEPYCLNPWKNIKLNKVEHKRFTMQDIGKLEKRITNVEEYVALSLLEKDTANMQIVDQFGLSRYKNGIFVDQFKDERAADLSAQDSNFSTDPGELCLRPSVNYTEIELREPDGITNAGRLEKGYVVNDDLITLPYTEEVMIEQKIASRGELINPFAVASFSGSMTATPNFDQWVERVQQPDNNIIIEGNYNEQVKNFDKKVTKVGEWTTTKKVYGGYVIPPAPPAPVWNDWGWGSCCFPENSLVLMVDGSWKKIQDVVEGDVVYSPIGGSCNIVKVKTPILGNRPMYQMEDESISWSAEHLFWTNRENKQWWWSAGFEHWIKEVEAGDVVGLKDNSTMYKSSVGDVENFAHIESQWKTQSFNQIDADFNTTVYLPIGDKGQPIVVNGYLVTAGTNEWECDYTKFDWNECFQRDFASK